MLSFEFGLCLLLWLLTGWFVGKALGIANWRVDQMSIDDMKFGRTPPSPNFFRHCCLGVWPGSLYPT